MPGLPGQTAGELIRGFSTEQEPWIAGKAVSLSSSFWGSAGHIGTLKLPDGVLFTPLYLV